MITMVLSAYKMPNESMLNFVNWNKDQFEEHGVKVIMVSDREVELGVDWAKVIAYPVEQEVFSLCKTNNYGIKRVEDDGIIIKTDPDIWFSKQVLQKVKDTVKYQSGMIGICSNLSKLEHTTQTNWSAAKKRNLGRGACFAMSKKDWFEMCGYDERLEGWGGDDNEMWRRAASKINIIQDHSCPLFHINHPQRKDVAKHFPMKSSQNMRICKNLDWSNPNWGEAGLK